ncbi:MAG: response regulator [Desulfuromonadales bacterium]|nr:response regulator [Desulfuromonadales bacterium]
MSAEEKYSMPPAEIMIIEDEEIALRLLSTALTKADYQVRAFGDAESALRSVRSKRPDLILLDVNLPGMGGLDLCRCFKADSETDDLPVIFLSGEKNVRFKAQAFEAGCVDYVTKPYDVVELLVRVNTQLKVSRLQQRLADKSKALAAEVKERQRVERELVQQNACLEGLIEKRTVVMQKKEESYRTFLTTVVDGVPEALMVINRDYTIAMANRTVREMAKSDPVAAGLTCHQVSHRSDIPCNSSEHQCPLEKVVETKAPVTVEHIHYDANGCEINVELTAAPIFDEKGEVIQIVELCHDVTRRKRRDRILAARFRLSELASQCSVEELLQTVLDEAEQLTGSEIGFFHFIEKDQKTLHLQAWSTNTLKSLCTSDGADSHYPIDRAGVWVDCVRERRAVIHNDYASLPHKKGLPEGHTPVVRELVIPVMRENQVVAILGVGNKKTDYEDHDVESVSELANMAWDIVSRKQAEEQAVRFSRVLENSLNEIYIFDAETFRFIEVNRGAREHLGYTLEELRELTPAALKPEISNQQFEEIVKPLRTGEQDKLQFAAEHQCKDGSRYPVAVYLQYISDRSPVYVAIVVDITERKRAEAEQEKLEAQLQHSQKLDAIGQLAGGVAHDFNNLLQGITGYGQIALNRVGENCNSRKFLEGMLGAADRAKTLTSQLLAFSHRQVLDMKDVDLNQVIANLTDMLERVIGEQVTLEVVTAPELGVVCADPGQIDQILTNLCVNARDAMSYSGTILIETENVTIDESYCQTHSWAKPGHYALLSVTDTGCGMDQETLANMFEPFFTTKPVGKGSGLGLSMVYGLIKQHQGLIHVQSKLDQGTMFNLYLPVVERSVTVVSDQKTDSVVGGRETILLAEDEKLVLDLLQHLLEDAGYTVLPACDGMEALRLCDEHAGKIDLAILDVVMPKLSGRAVYERLSQLQPKIPVLFASGYSMCSIHTDFVLDEGLTLIQKPFLQDDLLRLVRESLDR